MAIITKQQFKSIVEKSGKDPRQVMSDLRSRGHTFEGEPAKKEATPTPAPVMGPPVPKVENKPKGIGDYLGEVKDAATDSVEQIGGAFGSLLKNPLSEEERAKPVEDTAAGAPSNLIRGVFGLISSPLAPLLGQAAETISPEKGREALSKAIDPATGFGDLAVQASQDIRESMGKSRVPDSEGGRVAQRDLKGLTRTVFDVAPLVVAPKVVNKTKDAAVTTAKVGGKVVDGVVAKVGEAKAAHAQSVMERASAGVDDIANKVAQGDTKDIPRVAQSLSSLDPSDVKGVKTYRDLVNVYDEKISAISTKLDEALLTDPTPRQLPTLVAKNGHNYAIDAIDQLENFYQKTNDVNGADGMAKIRAKAETEGLNIQELNDLARLHGRDLNAYNANNELASGLSKQNAENTRVGLKETARDLFGNEGFKAVDTELSALMRTRDLMKDMVEKVNNLKQKTVKYSPGERVGKLVLQVANLLTGGAIKGFVAAALPRGQGLKVLNALEMEKNLQRNLSKVQSLSKKGLKKGDAIKILEDIIRSNGGKPEPVKAK